MLCVPEPGVRSQRIKSAFSQSNLFIFTNLIQPGCTWLFSIQSSCKKKTAISAISAKKKMGKCRGFYWGILYMCVIFCLGIPTGFGYGCRITLLRFSLISPIFSKALLRGGCSIDDPQPEGGSYASSPSSGSSGSTIVALWSPLSSIHVRMHVYYIYIRFPF